MASENKYEYMADCPINELLVCEVCQYPLNDPRSTPCEHTFCYQCIIGWLTRTSSCPICRNSLSINELKLTDRIVIRMLDQLKVKCTRCGQTDIERGNFSDHVEKTCMNSTVSCPSAVINCECKGSRDLLNDHIAACMFESFRPMNSTNVTRKLVQFRRSKIFLSILYSLESFGNGNQNLREIISTNENCTELNLDQMELFDRDMEYVVEQVISKRWTKLCLSINKISSEGASILVNAVRNPSMLEELYLDHNRISDLGVQLLAQAISNNNNTKLKVLYLGSNSINYEGAFHLGEMLKANKTLRRLNLSENNLGDQGVQLLANALSYPNRSLLQLDLNSTKLADHSTVNSLIDMLRNNGSLEKLRLCNCNLSETHKLKLRDAAKLKQYFVLIL